ncbi:MAG: class I SAM-dependent methyltransferase [Kofleriaceae bacterium]|nr:class I SAM-dependent methyltransferase [Kofleriaceae bacterium]MBP9172616.1 class I SAM-dependent methyltransferase [Kofleriaceae bacterium]MBP9861445.1 class I SAM-dependent methyltransferase [Kofleriaceae bacterium]
MLSRVDAVAYRAQHLGFLLGATALGASARLLTRTPRPDLTAELPILRARTEALFARDLANVDAGLYPRELLFQLPTATYLRRLPQLLRDAPRVIARKRRGDYHDLPAVDRGRYPAYYRRTFHWQTDGYLSPHSAAVYDLGVELLFRGTADVMRRQVIPPISRWLASRPAGPRVRVLDVACGTGRTLRQLATAHPDLAYHGVDLSVPYLQAARALLADVGEVTLAAENAEALPYADATFDVATSVYLFHELPRNARRRVMAELVRVVRPGGLIVLEDSAQHADSPELAAVLAGFPREFHEPFYADYLDDDLAGMATAAGAVDVTAEPILVAKLVTARRP